MSRLTELLRQTRKVDPQLGSDLEKEVAALMKRRTFGLVFEQHQPEAVELPGRTVRRGDKVRVLPPRGELKQGDQRLWQVDRIERVDGSRVAHLSEIGTDQPEEQSALAEDVVVVAEFRDRIFPGLVETGRVERGGADKPFHTVINAENYHALEMLTYTHRHTVDAIYIDPPYNTGAKDWKYNNNYVEGDDDYRHSKWLAFIERRLEVSRELLKPSDSVLIVTIDEKEYLRLGLLLEQTFPEARIQMISDLINPAGSSRRDEFGRSNEYIFIVQFGESSPGAIALGPEWFGPASQKRKNKIRWQELSRRGDNGRRQARPNLFYPLFVAQDGSRIHSVGDPIALDADPSTVLPPPGTVACWPIRSDGSHGSWGRNSESLKGALSQGFVRIGSFTPRGIAVYHLAAGEQRKVTDGTYKVTGRRNDGSIIVDDTDYVSAVVPGNHWSILSHDASTFGSGMLRAILPGRRFPFPKSLYSVEDVLRFFIKEKPNAVVLDYFSGSGTTAHAVMRLNRQHGGQRQCISVTNNEVGSGEQKLLRQQGLRPGDPQWEAQGICDYFTKPRVAAAITGTTPTGDPIKGAYRFTDEFPMNEGFEENAAFFTLTYEAPLSVRHNRAFERVAPMLWMRAGSQGRIITALGEDGWDVAEAYGVLQNIDQLSDFVAKVAKSETVKTVFVVTDSDAAFQITCRDLPDRVTVVRLYESYLHNFQINRSARA